MDTDEESAVGIERIRSSRRKEQHTMQEDASAATLAKTRSLRSLHSHRSYAASDGYTCFQEQDERPTDGSGDDEFLVQWDGDADPLNPRSMSKLRRWLIVLIMCSSSLCV